MGYQVTEAKYQTCICGKVCKGRAALANHGKKCPTERARSRAFLAADHALTDREFLTSIVTEDEATDYAARYGVSLLDAYRAIAAVRCAMVQMAQQCTMRCSRHCAGDSAVTVKASFTNTISGIKLERNLCPACRELVKYSDHVYANYTELEGATR